MRTRLCLVAALSSLSFPAVVQANPFQYTFTGVVNTFPSVISTLDLGDGNGPVDLGGAAFTLTGLIGERCCYDAAPGGFGVWASSPIWDFGARGSFSMEHPLNDATWTSGTMAYDQFTNNGQTTLRVYLWYPGQIDLQGFGVTVAALPTDPSVLMPFSAVPLDIDLPTFTGNYGLRMKNDARQELWFGNALGYPVVTITSASVQEVPEPGTLTLLAVGIGSLVAAQRRRRLT